MNMARTDRDGSRLADSSARPRLPRFRWQKLLADLFQAARMFHQLLGSVLVLARPGREVVQRGPVLVEEVLELGPVLVLGAEGDHVLARVLDRPVDEILGL